jgi:hypothetical protein
MLQLIGCQGTRRCVSRSLPLTLCRSAPSDPAPAGDDPRDARCARVPLNNRQTFADIGEGSRHLAVPTYRSASASASRLRIAGNGNEVPAQAAGRVSQQISAHYGHQLSARCQTAEKAIGGRLAMRPRQRYHFGWALCIFVAVFVGHLVPGAGIEPARRLRDPGF